LLKPHEAIVEPQGAGGMDDREGERMNEAPILLVEDDTGHSLLVQRVLKKARVANPVVAFGNGDEAVDYLAGQGEYGDRASHPLPVLVLLDGHVPGRSGLEILSWIRERAALMDLPVVMFSGSGEAESINRAFEIGADSYLVKPVAFEALLDTIDEIGLPRLLLPRGATG
jgi:DNA-binding response OmpR family regulator